MSGGKCLKIAMPKLVDISQETENIATQKALLESERQAKWQQAGTCGANVHGRKETNTTRPCATQQTKGR